MRTYVNQVLKAMVDARQRPELHVTGYGTATTGAPVRYP
jgi:hypothetical protein